MTESKAIAESNIYLAKLFLLGAIYEVKENKILTDQSGAKKTANSNKINLKQVKQIVISLSPSDIALKSV